MKLLFDFFPIALFFISYKLYGIYVATIIVIAASFLQIGVIWLKHRKVELTHIITLILVSTLGTATLFFRNELFIKWKPTAVYWIFALLFFGSQIIGKKSFFEHLMGQKLSLPKNAWTKLNYSWVIFFIVMGGLNLYVAYQFNTDVWVNFKLFGVLGSTIVFGVAQSLYIAKFLKNSQEK